MHAFHDSLERSRAPLGSDVQLAFEAFEHAARIGRKELCRGQAPPNGVIARRGTLRADCRGLRAFSSPAALGGTARPWARVAARPWVSEKPTARPTACGAR